MFMLQRPILSRCTLTGFSGEVQSASWSRVLRLARSGAQRPPWP